MVVVALTTHIQARPAHVSILRFVCESSPGTDAATLIHSRPIKAKIMKHTTIRTIHDRYLLLAGISTFLTCHDGHKKKKNWRATQGCLLRRRSSNNFEYMFCTQEKRASLEAPFRFQAVAALLQLQVCCSCRSVALRAATELTQHRQQ
jgi:hypothetical protein